MRCWKCAELPEKLELEAEKLFEQYMALDEPGDADDHWAEYADEHASPELLKWWDDQAKHLAEMEAKGIIAG